jgi:hypothetical protein
VVGQDYHVAAAVWQPACDDEMVFAGYRGAIILRWIATRIFHQPAVRHIAIGDGHGATRQEHWQKQERELTH